MKDKLLLYRKQKNETKKVNANTSKSTTPTAAAVPMKATVTRVGKRRNPTSAEIKAKMDEYVMLAHTTGIEVGRSFMEAIPTEPNMKDIETHAIYWLTWTRVEAEAIEWSQLEALFVRARVSVTSASGLQALKAGEQQLYHLHTRPMIQFSSQDVCVDTCPHIVLRFQSPRKVYHDRNDDDEDDYYSPTLSQLTTIDYHDDNNNTIIDNTSNCSVTTRRLWDEEPSSTHPLRTPLKTVPLNTRTAVRQSLSSSSREEDQSYFDKICLGQCQDLLVDDDLVGDDPMVNISTHAPPTSFTCMEQTNQRLRSELQRCEERICEAAKRTSTIIGLHLLQMEKQEEEINAHQPQQLAMEKFRNRSVLVDILYASFNPNKL